LVLIAYGSVATDAYYFDEVQIEESPEGVLSVLDPAQAWYNAHSVAGGTPEMAPASDAFESYPGGDPVVNAVVDEGVLAESVKKGFRFSTPVSFPYSIAPGGDLDVQVGYHPQSAGSKETMYLLVQSYEDTKPKMAVTLTGRAVSKFLALTPDETFVTRRQTDGTFAPSEKLYAVANQSTTTAVAWAAQASDDWFEVVPATGAVDPETSASLTVRITAKAQELPVGVTLGTLTLQDLTHGVVTTSTVRVEVASGAQIGVAPTSLTATLLMGEATTAAIEVSMRLFRRSVEGLAWCVNVADVVGGCFGRRSGGDRSVGFGAWRAGQGDFAACDSGPQRRQQLLCGLLRRPACRAAATR
jgi:hypothetical protein